MLAYIGEYAPHYAPHYWDLVDHFQRGINVDRTLGVLRRHKLVRLEEPGDHYYVLTDAGRAAVAKGRRS